MEYLGNKYINVPLEDLNSNLLYFVVSQYTLLPNRNENWDDETSVWECIYVIVNSLISHYEEFVSRQRR